MRIKDKIKMVVTELRVVSKEKLMKILGIHKKDKRKFNEIIKTMTSEGTIHIDLKNRIRIGAPEIFEGKFLATRKEFGFIENLDGEDLFVPAGKTMGAMNNDIVKYKIVGKERGKDIAYIKEVDLSNKNIVGKAVKRRKKLIIESKDTMNFPIKITNYEEVRLKENGLYRVKLTEFDDRRQIYKGKVVDFIGFKGEKDVDLMSLVVEANVPSAFSDQAIKEADEVAQLPIVPNNRKDYRDMLTVTIDGLDAKDFDDAISVSRDENGFILTVHIADVSHYVKEYSELDKTAYDREMSIYLPGLVIPMLPEIISNGVCSLNPNVDRYSLSVQMSVSKSGSAKLLSIDKAIINSDHRLNYTDLNRFYAGESIEEYNNIAEFLNDARALYEILKKESVNRGNIEFESDEASFEIADDGKILGIHTRERGIGERLIEEFMILANKMVATKYFQKELPFLYRVHEAPTDEKITSLRSLLRPYGIKVGDDMEAKDFQELLNGARENEAFDRINDLVLRSMTKADYRSENEGHFALALKNYSHFTSPIRRYPDLFIHRIISMDLEKKLNSKKIKEEETRSRDVADRATSVERVILDLERNAIQLKKCEYMKEKIGSVYRATVSGVVEFGVFVMLDNTVEGLVHADNIDKYRFNENTMTATAKGFEENFEVGREVFVRLVNVSVSRMQIDFEFISREEYGENICTE